MIVEIKGAGFQNYGAWLMHTAVVQRLEAVLPGVQIAMSARRLVTRDGARYSGLLRKVDLRARWLDLNGLTRFIPRWLRQRLLMRGVVFECDLSMIIDVAGFGYSDQWGRDYPIRHAAAEVVRMNESGRHYFFMPQAMGPFQTAKARSAIRTSMPLASLVALRDPVSFAAIHEITGGFRGLSQYPDFTNSVEMRGDHFEMPTAPYFVIVPNANMLVSGSSNTVWSQNYAEVLFYCIESALHLDLKVVLLNFGGAMDQPLVDELATRCDEAEVWEAKSELHAKALMAGATVAMSSRYHACVSALSAGVPCLATSWSHKYQALYDDYGVSDMLLSCDVQREDIVQLVKQLMSPAASQRGTILEKAAEQKTRTEAMWRTFEATVGGAL